MKRCSQCDSDKHTAFLCPSKPRPQLKRGKGLTTKKRMNKIGKIGQKLIDQRKQFLEENDPPYYCIYCLYIGIDPLPLLPEWVNVEHMESKARHPELRFVKGNLAVSCAYHNAQKKSKGITEYLQILDKQRENGGKDNNGRN